MSLVFLLPARDAVHRRRKPSLSGIGRVITRRDVLLPTLLAPLSQYANWAITFSFLPILAKQLGATDVALSLLVSMHLGLLTISSLVAAPAAGRLGTRRLVLGTFLLMSLGVGIAAVDSSLTMVFASQLCIGVATGLGYPVLMGMSIRDVADEERTTAIGLHQAVYATGMFAGA